MLVFVHLQNRISSLSPRVSRSSEHERLPPLRAWRIISVYGARRDERKNGDAAVKARGPFFLNDHHLNNVTRAFSIASPVCKAELVPESGQSAECRSWRSFLPLHDMAGTMTAETSGTPPGTSLFHFLLVSFLCLFDTDNFLLLFLEYTALPTDLVIWGPTEPSHRQQASGSEIQLRRPTAGPFSPSHSPSTGFLPIVRPLDFRLEARRRIRPSFDACARPRHSSRT